MYNLRRIFNQNIKQILIAILAIVFVIVFIKILNNDAKQRAEQRKNMPQNTQINSSTYNPSYSVTTGSQIDEKKSNENLTIINNFYTLCNNAQIQQAYDLLSSDCKEQLYPTLQAFKTNYYQANFTTPKIYNIQLWIADSYTYKIEMYEDALATGKVQTLNSKEDYITIIKENDEQKLNINSYIGKQVINKQITKNGITVTVDYKQTYKDYEIYRIYVENRTQNEILLDSMESTKNMYLIGSNEVNYTAYSYELNESNMKVRSYYKNTLDIKYNKAYTSDSISKKLVFADVILNAQEYEKSTNKKQYKDRIELQIEL